MNESNGSRGDDKDENRVSVADSRNVSDLTLSMTGLSTQSPPPPSSVGTSNDNKLQGDDDDDDSSAPPPPATSPPPPISSLPSTPKYQAKHLHGNLMRELKHRDPLFNYEIVQVLGTGSMGSVAKVKKRGSAIGGSARRQLQQQFTRERQLRECASIPIFGSIFKHCLQGFFQAHKIPNAVDGGEGEDRSVIHMADSTTSSILNPDKNNAFQTVEQDEDGTYQLVYAMKSIHLSRVLDPTFVEELRNEVRILRTIDHPHIVRPMETYEHRNQIFIVMELCSGGDLYSRDPYTEAEAARIVSCIISAISYMHAMNICHRDLKYENIMFINDDAKAEVKLIDFGLSKKFGPGENLTEGVGTIYTMAPEVLKGNYSKQADLWSIGVIAYMLLSSQMPFYGRKRRQIVESIMAGSFDFKGRRWKRMSAQSKEFVKSLLVVDPEERLDADEALGAVWLNRRMTATVRNPHADEIENATNSIVRYSRYSKLKKMALMVVAHRSTTSEIGILRKIFQKYDTKKDGRLSIEEFKSALRDAGYPEEECEAIFHSVDLDGTGSIRYTEFLAATIEAHGAISEERLAEAFDRIDSDDSGFISADNLKALLGEEFPQSEIDAIIKESDLTKDGKISYSEFLALWEDKNETKYMRDIHSIRQLRDAHDSERSSIFSDNSSEADASELGARANFLEEKRMSERKVHEETVQVQVPADDRPRQVGFKEMVQTIPPVDSQEGEDNVTSNGGQTTKLKKESYV